MAAAPPQMRPARLILAGLVQTERCTSADRQMDKLEPTMGKAQLLSIAMLGLGVATSLLPHSHNQLQPPLQSSPPSPLSPPPPGFCCAKCLPIMLSYPC